MNKVNLGFFFTVVDLMDVTMVDRKLFTKMITVKMKLDPLGFLLKEEALQADQDLVVVEIIGVNPIVMNLAEILTSYLVSSRRHVMK